LELEVDALDLLGVAVERAKSFERHAVASGDGGGGACGLGAGLLTSRLAVHGRLGLE